MNHPTKYYYRLPGCRYDSIKSLWVNEELTVSSSNDILQECHRFYSNLYNKPFNPNAKVENLQWNFLKHAPMGLDVPGFELLGKELSKQELYGALKVMKKDASPGPDGLTVRFYLHFWDHIGDLVFNSLKSVESNGKMSDSQRRGVIRLIPKKQKDMLQICNWCPITLLNVDYKLLSKALALRLAQVLPKLISNDQQEFVRDRSIGDNVFDLYSIIEQAQDEEEGMIIMLDIEKAFDSVSWDFLHEVMENSNFPSQFMDWVKALYLDKELRIINHGFLSQPLYPSNGLAQGDGLSPLLFVLVIETLANNIHANDNIQGFKVNSIHKKLGLLADEIIPSLKAKQISFSQLLETLQLFAQISNLQVNMDKTMVFPIGPECKAPQLVDIAPFKWCSDEVIDYLGITVPLTRFTPRQHPVASILTYAKSVLGERNSPQFNIFGRNLNIKTFIASKLNYYFALAPAPTVTFLPKVQSFLTSYIWNGAHHVAAQLMYRPFDRGGLNMYSIVIHMQASKLKSINKLFTTSDQYWQVYLQMKFRFPIDLIAHTNVSITHVSKLFHNNFRNRFWKQAFNIWAKINFRPAKSGLLDTLLVCNSAVQSPLVFNPKIMDIYVNNGVITVRDLLLNDQQFHMSCSSLRANVIKSWPARALSANVNLVSWHLPMSLRALQKLIMQENQAKPVKVWQKWSLQLDNNLVAQTWPSICNLRLQFTTVRLKVFHWKFINRAIYTNAKLHKFGKRGSSLCTFCQQEQETFSHIFWDCSLVKNLWEKVIQWCHIYVDTDATYNQSNCLLFGFDNKTLNNVFIIVKYYIYIQQHFNSKVTVIGMFNSIKSYKYRDFISYD